MVATPCFRTKATAARTSSTGMALVCMTSSPIRTHCPLSDTMPSNRDLSTLSMSSSCRPVEMNSFIPCPRSASSAFRVLSGILCVLKLTNVPSISKNTALTMIFPCKVTFSNRGKNRNIRRSITADTRCFRPAARRPAARTESGQPHGGHPPQPEHMTIIDDLGNRRFVFFRRFPIFRVDISPPPERRPLRAAGRRTRKRQASLPEEGICPLRIINLIINGA